MGATGLSTYFAWDIFPPPPTNKPFGAWDTIFPDPAMTLAAVDRLVHHASIFEMNAESYRRKAAEKVKGPGRPPQKASPADIPSD